MAAAPPKKDSSYTYWIRQQTDQAAPAPVPRKLSVGDLAQNAQAPPLGSLWNQAGTWEERSLTTWATKRITELLLSIEPLEFSEGRARVTEISSCVGDATLVTVRNKKRFGYSYAISIKVTGEWRDLTELEGTLKVPEACFNDLDDLQMEVDLTMGEGATDFCNLELTEALKSFLPEIRNKLQEFEDELKDR